MEWIPFGNRFAEAEHFSHKPAYRSRRNEEIGHYGQTLNSPDNNCQGYYFLSQFCYKSRDLSHKSIDTAHEKSYYYLSNIYASFWQYQ